MARMTERETDLLIRYYIGVDRYGRLTNIRNTEELRYFYQVDCDLDIEPASGRRIIDEFVAILKAQSPHYQARILRAALQEFFVKGVYGMSSQEKLLPRLEAVAQRLQSESTLVETEIPPSPSETVRLAIEGADILIRRGNAPSAVDRIHTALHTRMRDNCDDEGIVYKKDPSLNELFKLLQKEHDAFAFEGPRKQDISKILNSLANILDALNPIRNRASLSHPPEDELLEESEAMLAINAARSVFNYIEEKVTVYQRIKEIPY